jgi:hypothetical protein
MSSTTPAVLNDVRFYGLLLKFDQDLAAQVREGGCPVCAAALHSASYLRKPRGGPAGLGKEYRERLSLCCAADGCRRRSRPPSLRFLGRHVYWGAVIILISALRCGPTPVRMRQLKEWVGVSRQTVLRWQAWWRHVLPETACWRAACGAFSLPVASEELPLSVLERFTGELEDRLLGLLRLLAPLSGGNRSTKSM